MGRFVALAASLLVAVGVFTWLAGPLLEAQFGTEALIVTYGTLALALGCVTYVLVRRSELVLTGRSREPIETTPEITISLDDDLVDQEMEQLKDE